jgi:4-hydroxybenzoate polyprenyltransferase
MARHPRPVTAQRAPPGSTGSKLSLVRILHPFPSLLVAGLAVAIAVFADRDAPTSIFARLGFGMLAYQFSIGIANDVVDLEDDRVAKPWKPFARGVLPRQFGVLSAAACAGAGLLITASLPTTAWLVGALGLFCGLLYDVYFKRTPFSWFPYAVAFPTIPAVAYLSLGVWDDVLWWVFPLGAVLGLSLHIANQAPDTAADVAAGSGGATRYLGERRARAASIALFGITASAGALILLTRDAGSAVIAAVDGAAVTMLAPRAPMFFGRDGLFGLLAVGSAILAVVFLSAV